MCKFLNDGYIPAFGAGSCRNHLWGRVGSRNRLRNCGCWDNLGRNGQLPVGFWVQRLTYPRTYRLYLLRLFKHFCTTRSRKFEEKELTYAIYAEVVREGGFLVPIVMRFSAIPGHCK